MCIGADRGEIPRVQAAFAEFAESHGLPAELRRGMLIVLDELLANAVGYGLAGVADGSVTAEVELHPAHLAVTLTDNGRPFDPLARAAPDTTLSVEDRPIGGLGIHLVRHLVDEIRYQRIDHHNVVSLVKHLASEVAQP